MAITKMKSYNAMFHTLSHETSVLADHSLPFVQCTQLDNIDSKLWAKAEKAGEVLIETIDQLKERQLPLRIEFEIDLKNQKTMANYFK